ncbi:MAG: hypothetical protein LBS33_06630, partial [Streptococcaceae bacterium]|nr:hypothetical protein [Streptococcaceae bacterium]
LGAIATLGIFAGTYAKYVSVLPLTSNGDDLSARVAIWNVGVRNNIELALFRPYYYGATVDGVDSNSSSANSGHGDATDSEKDTVFTNNGDNLVAPGTHGFKFIEITNATGGGPRLKAAQIPTTEVTYKLTVGDIAPSATITDEVDTDVFKGQLWVAVLTDFGENGDQSPMVNWGEDTYRKSGDENTTYVSIPWKNVTDALAGMYTDGDNATNLGNVKEIKKIVVLWKWDFEKGETSDEISANDAKDNSLGKATELPTISINFGTIRAEQVD